MTLYEVGFRLQHDCPFNDLSREYPSLTISHWCNHGKDVMEISCPDLELFEQLQGDLDRLAERLGVKITRKSFAKPNVQIVTQQCGCVNIKAPVASVIEDKNCLELQPTIYKEGWEWYRIIGFSEKDVKSLFKVLDSYCKIEMLSRDNNPYGSVRDTFIVSTASLFGQLTAKQSQALILALDNGYYRVPKKVTTEEIAGRLGLPRTTYEEHLRKAEGKVLRAIAPYIRFSG